MAVVSPGHHEKILYSGLMLYRETHFGHPLAQSLPTEQEVFGGLGEIPIQSLGLQDFSGPSFFLIFNF